MDENEVKRTPAGAVRQNKKKPVNKKNRRKSRKKRGSINILQAVQPQNLIIAGVFFLLLLLIFFGIRSCGSRNSPEKAVKELIRAYGDGKAKKAKKCYKISESNEEIVQKEIDATIQYFQAHKPQKVSIDRCGVLSENSDYTYVYIIYSLELENGQAYPCISTYMTGKEKRKYYVYSPSDITEEMSEQAASDYVKFMTTNIYKNYVTAYDTFIKKNPGYEDKIAGRLQ